jgi:hypothetical protein
MNRMIPRSLGLPFSHELIGQKTVPLAARPIRWIFRDMLWAVLLGGSVDNRRLQEHLWCLMLIETRVVPINLV